MNWQEAAFITSAVKPPQFPDHARREIALAGRSNVGKSSLINRLLGRKSLALTSRNPGRTRTLNFYAVGDELCLVDLPGYGFARVSKAERERWRRNIERYFREREQLVGVIQVVDIRHPPTDLDRMMAGWLRELGLAAVAVVTKADKVSRGRWKGRTEAAARDLGLPVLLFSAETGAGRVDVIRWMEAVLADPGVGRNSSPQRQ